MKQLELIYQGLKDCKEIDHGRSYRDDSGVDFYGAFTGRIKGKYFRVALIKTTHGNPKIEITLHTDCRCDLKRILKSIDPTYIKILEKL